MKTHKTIIAIITIILFGITGIILFKGFSPIYKRHLYFTDLKEIYLTTTDKHQPGNLDSIYKYRRHIIKAYLFNTDHKFTDTIPPADLYICGFSKDSVSEDTILIFDTKLQDPMSPKYSINDYWIELQETKQLKKCKVQLPQTTIDEIHKHNYRYKYENITLVTDD